MVSSAEFLAMWEKLDSSDSEVKFIIGMALTIVATIIVEAMAKGPVLKIINKSKNQYDDLIFNQMRPLFDVGAFLVGLWLTIDWVFTEGSIAHMIFGSGSVLLLLLITAKCLSGLVKEFVPILLNVFDDDTEMDLSSVQKGVISVLNLIIWAAAILVSFAQFDIDVTAFVASATVVSLVIGMALQESASGLVAGGLMAFDKPFKKGDKVIVAGVKGRITQIGLLSTHIKTGEERMVIIPNKQLAGEKIENYAQGNSEYPEQMNLRHRLQVDKKADPIVVKQIISDIIDECEYTIEHSKTEILLYDILDSGLMFRIDCWITDYNDERRARDWILCEVISRFKNAGIDLPYPHIEIRKDEQTN